jgi:hypothetical protein
VQESRRSSQRGGQSRGIFQKNTSATEILIIFINHTVIDEKGGDYMRKYTVLMALGIFSMMLIGVQLSASPATESTISADVNIDPEVFNLRQRGMITAYISNLAEYDVRDVNKSTIELYYKGNFIVEALRATVENDILIVKFDATEVANYIWLNIVYHMGTIPPQANYTIELTVSGRLLDTEEQFAGSDTVKIIHEVS